VAARDRGPYTSVYAALIDSPEYDALSRNAASVFWALKCCPENGITGIMRAFPDQIARRAKVKPSLVRGALRELEEGDWIRTEGEWVWIRNHLRFDPGYEPTNPKHVAGLVRKMEGLPRIGLVCQFTRYYKELGYLPPGLECKGRKSIPVAVAVAVSVASTVTNTVTTALTVRSKAVANPASSARPLESPDSRALIDAYNAVFSARIGPTPGNLKAADRMYGQGYTLEQALTLFHAVHESRTPTAAWCAEKNREFEFLVRPSYRHTRTQEMVPAMIDRVLNELGSGRRTEERRAT
jgi:hypothetical protein